ncbi:DUF6232 family protein [Streptomyces sp. NBC_00335]|uniref:DUF6232 family protein n=1 Tax=unclassified Streptomyces TaxID=2593676 RepID=UPI0022553C9E|nr:MULTISPECIES: DUF6232 family protein [unclassified Streptomyces]MCX5404542.1 DUF6232 family protein [Streptomyces sp. NBC_00086]
MDSVRYEHGTGGSVISEHEVIEVRVARRVLWVGADAFPVANITRVTTSMVPARAAAVSAFVRFMILLALVTAGGVTAFRDADRPADRHRRRRGGAARHHRDHPVPRPVRLTRARAGP